MCLNDYIIDIQIYLNICLLNKIYLQIYFFLFHSILPQNISCQVPFFHIFHFGPWIYSNDHSNLCLKYILIFVCEVFNLLNIHKFVQEGLGFSNMFKYLLHFFSSNICLALLPGVMEGSGQRMYLLYWPVIPQFKKKWFFPPLRLLNCSVLEPPPFLLDSFQRNYAIWTESEAYNIDKLEKSQGRIDDRWSQGYTRYIPIIFLAYLWHFFLHILVTS